MAREIPLYTLDGVVDAEVTQHGFCTEDGLGLSLLRFRRGQGRMAVMIVHGLTTSSDMFIQPEHRNLVSFLLDEGVDEVWTLDFRMSNRHPYNLQPNRYSMDDCALFDFPAAVAKIRQVAGDDVELHVIAHCLGSMGFAMALFGGTVSGIRSCILNSVALTPHVPRWSRIKGHIFPFVIERIFQQPYVSPRWSEDPRFTLGKLLSKGVSLFHRECDVPACHMLSLMWGTGWPALYNHENLDERTHRRGGDLYGPVGLNYHRHVLKMLGRGHRTVKMREAPEYAALPDDYLLEARRVDTPCLLLTGRDNRVFTDSNVHCHRALEEAAPGRHELAIIDGYGHQDVFMGARVDREVFPRLMTFLNAHT
ncbi:alpha/beta hydrolase [Halomonas sp. DN3]|uniref:alpha/beta hydrolase n=1 Tax=Halomonas sp. DN3 TaxID=2953657 RepID=UPI00209F064C|nr:alpha/beta hydrolase [Halomonas sp. DN3]USZ49109.1 alpha/beta hydrolase [Halomonas sp. DN3]